MSGEKVTLEGAINDAVDMASLTVEFVGQGLHFDDKEIPTLVDEEVRLLMFALHETRAKAERAKAAFYAMCEARLI